MNSKDVGTFGEAKVLCKFLEFDIPVYIPFGDNQRSDLIAEFNGKLNKIQVKTSNTNTEGSVKFILTSSTSHRINGNKKKYLGEIDYFACYSIKRDVIYLLDINKYTTCNITIRYAKPLNNQNKNIIYEKDCIINNVLRLNSIED